MTISVPMGQFRLQLLSFADGEEVLAMAHSVLSLAHALGIQPRMKYWSAGKWNSYRPKDLPRKDLVRTKLNQIVLSAHCDPENVASKKLAIENVSATLSISPLNSLWGDTSVSAQDPRQDGARFTFHAKQEFVREQGLTTFPSILDILLFRSRTESELDGEDFFNLFIEIAEPACVAVAYGCGDFDRRANNVLEELLLRSQPLDLVRSGIEDAHRMFILDRTLASSLAGRLDKMTACMREVSSKHVAILLRAGVMNDPDARQKIRGWRTT